MGEISTERLAPSARVMEPNPQPSARDPVPRVRRKPQPANSSDHDDADAPEAPPHQVDRLA